MSFVSCLFLGRQQYADTLLAARWLSSLLLRRTAMRAFGGTQDGTVARCSIDLDAARSFSFFWMRVSSWMTLYRTSIETTLFGDCANANFSTFQQLFSSNTSAAECALISFTSKAICKTRFYVATFAELQIAKWRFISVGGISRPWWMDSTTTAETHSALDDSI